MLNIKSILTIFSKFTFILGQGTNTSLGFRKGNCECVGTFNLNNRNDKGNEALNILKINIMHVSMIFFMIQEQYHVKDLW